MRSPLALALLCLTVALGCGPGVEPSGVGEVTAIDPSRRHLTVRHEDIPGVMGPMTMRFPLASPGAAEGIAVGDRIRFTLARRAGAWTITSVTLLAPTAAPPGGSPPAPGTSGVHDHTPHHGGVVGMSGETHLEALIDPDGRVRVWVTDLWRRPRAIDDVRGRVTLELAEGDRTVPFRAAGDALEAAAGPLDVPEVPARVVLDVGGTAVDMDFLLPVAGSDPGAASVPLRGCVPVPAAPDGLRPRCVLEFPRAVSALAATPDGALVLVAGVDLGVTAWQLPEGSFLRGFAAAPPLAVPATDARPHSEAANAIAIRPDGTEAVVAVEGRLLRYAVTSGRLLRELPAQAGVVRAVAWSRDGRRLLASVFYDPTAHVLAADDGALLARLPVEREAAAVAFSADGTLAAVGNELGSIVLFDLASLAPLRELRGGRSPVSAVALANDRVVSAAGDGVLRVWDAGSGRLAHETAPGPMLAALAIARSGERAAAAGYDGVLRVVDLRTQAMERLAWHDAPVHALAWAGETLVSGDGRGRVALWDVR